jgi:transposase-like protein
MSARKVWSPEEKYRIVLQALRGEKSVSDLCRENQVSAAQFYKWRDLFLGAAAEGLKDKRRKVNQDPLEMENRQLKRILAEKELIIDGQKKLFRLDDERRG